MPACGRYKRGPPGAGTLPGPVAEAALRAAHGAAEPCGSCCCCCWCCCSRLRHMSSSGVTLNSRTSCSRAACTSCGEHGTRTTSAAMRVSSSWDWRLPMLLGCEPQGVAAAPRPSPAVRAAAAAPAAALLCLLPAEFVDATPPDPAAAWNAEAGLLLGGGAGAEARPHSKRLSCSLNRCRCACCWSRASCLRPACGQRQVQVQEVEAPHSFGSHMHDTIMRIPPGAHAAHTLARQAVCSCMEAWVSSMRR